MGLFFDINELLISHNKKVEWLCQFCESNKHNLKHLKYYVFLKGKHKQ